MEAFKKLVEKEDQLDYVVAMLTDLGDMLAGTDFPLLTYFVDMAAAQARDDYREVKRQTWRGSVARTGIHLH
jgi:hypothetical protein